MLDQGRVIEGANKTLLVSGQVSIQEDAGSRFGVVAKYPNDIRRQFEEALSNVEQVVVAAGMTKSDIMHMRFFVTDMKVGAECGDIVLAWWEDSLNRPPMSFLGINELFLPGLMVEIEATAMTA